MKLVSLGTGGFHPSELRHSPSFLLPEEGVLLDAGTATFRVTDRLVTDHLDILISHAHLDHIVGLTYLIELRDKCSTMRAFMSQRTAHAVRTHLFAEPLFPVSPPFEIVEIESAPTHGLRGGGNMTWFELEHPGGCHGYRLDLGDKSLAYVTDTTAGAESAYSQHIQDVDLLIHECYFPDGQDEFAAATGHSCATPVAQLARSVNAKQLLIVHVNPTPPAEDPIGMSVVREIFPGAQLGIDLAEINF